MPEHTVDTKLREEFNRWAQDGRGEEMAEHHLPIVLPMLAIMDPQPEEKWLDLGCGAGWLCRMLARRFPKSEFTGMDISGEMIESARRNSAGLENLHFETARAEEIPAEDGVFNRVVSVESAYYWPNRVQALKEIQRVLAPGGTAWILINYYRDNPYCHSWSEQLKIPVHLLSADEWAKELTRAGLEDIQTQRIPDISPSPEVYNGRWFRNAQELRLFKAAGALLIHARKP